MAGSGGSKQGAQIRRLQDLLRVGVQSLHCLAELYGVAALLIALKNMTVHAFSVAFEVSTSVPGIASGLSGATLSASTISVVVSLSVVSVVVAIALCPGVRDPGGGRIVPSVALVARSHR